MPYVRISSQVLIISYHSTETALTRVTNALLLWSDRGCISLLVLLDLSTAFDTIDHNILSNRLENDVGIRGSALAWIKSYWFSKWRGVIPITSAVWSTSRLRTKPLSFHALHVSPWEITVGNMLLAFTVMLMVLSSIFLCNPMKHTNLQI